MTDESIVSPPDAPPPGPQPPGYLPPVPPPPGYPPPGPPPNWQPGPGYQPGPGWQGQPAPKGGKTWLWVLIGLGVVLLLAALVVAVGCYACVAGVEKAADAIKEGSYSISHNGETHWVWRGSLQPRDMAPPHAARDADTLAGAQSIKAGIEAYREDTGSYPNPGAGTASTPASGDTSLQGLLAAAVDPWPVNPWTARPMADDPHRGDFLYVLWDDGTYTLRVFLSTGEKDL